MGSFWGSKPQAPQQPQQPGTNPAWWQPDPAPVQPQHPLMQQGAQVQEYVPKGKLVSRSSKAVGNCPECDSPNYMVTGRAVTQHGAVEVTRCFSCGYPVENSTRGMQGSVGGESDGRARQIPGAGGITHNYHPETIVDIAPGQRGPRTQ